MTIQVDAVFQDGVLRPTQPVALSNGAKVRIVIQLRPNLSDPLEGVIGVGDGPKSGDVAERHDDYIDGRR